ncbi:MAG: hypothetical protein COA83_11995 [Methylophaga sp.]|nr:MAG: hypothetical protein COA83_11995 [Methylophaga sp.]
MTDNTQTSAIKRIFWIATFAYIGFGMLIFVTHSNMIYHPNLIASDFNNCPAFAESEKININGTRVYYKNNNAYNIIVVYNGNAGSACDRSYLRSVFERYNYSFLFVEYIGYGGDDRTPSRKGLFNDAENITELLKTKTYTNTFIFAESLGAGVASYHSTLMPIKAMIFMTPFDSLINVAKTKFPIYPMFLLEKFSGENYDNLELLQNYQGELKIIHGTNDRVISFKHGKALYDGINSPTKKLFPIEGAGHNNLYNFEEVWEVIAKFLSKNQHNT